MSASKTTIAKSAASGGASQRKGGGSKVAPASLTPPGGATPAPAKASTRPEAHERAVPTSRIAKWVAVGALVCGAVGTVMGVIVGAGIALTDSKALTSSYVRLAALAASGDASASAALPPRPWDSEALWNESLSRLLPLTAGLGALSGVLTGAVGGWGSCMAQARVVEAEAG